MLAFSVSASIMVALVVYAYTHNVNSVQEHAGWFSRGSRRAKAFCGKQVPAGLLRCGQSPAGKKKRPDLRPASV